MFLFTELLSTQDMDAGMEWCFGNETVYEAPPHVHPVVAVTSGPGTSGAASAGLDAPDPDATIPFPSPVYGPSADPVLASSAAPPSSGELRIVRALQVSSGPTAAAAVAGPSSSSSPPPVPVAGPSLASGEPPIVQQQNWMSMDWGVDDDDDDECGQRFPGEREMAVIRFLGRAYNGYVQATSTGSPTPVIPAPPPRRLHRHQAEQYDEDGVICCGQRSPPPPHFARRRLNFSSVAEGDEESPDPFALPTVDEILEEQVRQTRHFPIELDGRIDQAASLGADVVKLREEVMELSAKADRLVNGKILFCRFTIKNLSLFKF
jgi:hypothetical protein